MRKSLILVATAIGGGVGYAAGVTEVATGPGTGDPLPGVGTYRPSSPPKATRPLDIPKLSPPHSANGMSGTARWGCRKRATALA